MKEYLLLNFTATFHCLGKDRMDLLSLNGKEQGEKKNKPKPAAKIVFLFPLFVFFPLKMLIHTLVLCS